jgi:endoglucanase
MILAVLVFQGIGCGESERLIGRIGAAGKKQSEAGSDGRDEPVAGNDGGGEAGVRSLPLLPLHTESRWIMDAKNRRFRLASVVWYGAESPDWVPYGLDHNSVQAIARLIKEMGFNSVRLPWCNEMYETNPVIAASLLSANPSLLGKTALEVLDVVIEALAGEGIVIILDNHRSRGDWCCDVAHGDGLWRTAEYPEANWIADWEGLVRRYLLQPAIVGADVRDAPRAQLASSAPPSCTDCNDTCPCDVATWGGTDPLTDWPSAAERAGNAIHAINPDLLIIVEGVELSRTIPANLRPVVLAVAHRVVYSPHDYPYTYDGVMAFASYDAFRTTLDQAWGFLLTEGQPYTGPVWSVFGANHRGVDATWWGWMRQYVREKDVDWAYWALNGTEGRGYSRTFGAEEQFGMLNVDWNGPASAGHLDSLQTLPRPLPSPP